MASPKESFGQHKTRMPKPIVLVSALLALFALIAAGRYASTFIKKGFSHVPTTQGWIPETEALNA